MNLRQINTLLLALCVAISLQFTQYAGLHMHVQHEEAGVTSDHAHQFQLHHSLGHDSIANAVDHSSHIDIDMGQDKLFKYFSSPDVIALFFLIGLLLSPRSASFCSRQLDRFVFSRKHVYLLSPPLRAPPL